jgi:hypothetical protein
LKYECFTEGNLVWFASETWIILLPSSRAVVNPYSADALWEVVNPLFHIVFGNTNGVDNPTLLLTKDAYPPSNDWNNVTEPTQMDIDMVEKFSTFWKDMDKAGWESHEFFLEKWRKKILHNMKAWEERGTAGTGASGGGGDRADKDDNEEEESGDSAIDVDDEEEDELEGLDLKNEPAVEDSFNCVKALLHSGDESLINKALWSLVATMAAAQVGVDPQSKKVTTLKGHEIHLQMYTSLGDVIKNLSVMELFREDLFDQMPHNLKPDSAAAANSAARALSALLSTKEVDEDVQDEDGDNAAHTWPVHFSQFVKMKLEKMPKGNVLKDMRKKSGANNRPADQDEAEWEQHVLSTVRKMYTGKSAWDEFTETKKEIVNRVNPLWLDPGGPDFPSGASVGQMMQATSRAYYKAEAKSEARKAVAARIRRANINNKQESLTTENTGVEKEIQTRMAKYKTHSYPFCWLSFFFCGGHAQWRQLTDKRYRHCKADLLQNPTIRSTSANKADSSMISTTPRSKVSDLILQSQLSGAKSREDSASDYTLSKNGRRRRGSDGGDDDSEGNNNSNSNKKHTHEVVIKMQEGGGELSHLRQVEAKIALL